MRRAILAAAMLAVFASPAAANERAEITMPCLGCIGGGSGGSGTAPGVVPPEVLTTSPGGVDMRSGVYNYQHVDLSIGGERGLTLMRLSDASSYREATKFNWDIYAIQTRIEVDTANTIADYDYLVSIHYGQKSATFRAPTNPSPDAFYPVSNGDYSRLTFTGHVDSSGRMIPDFYTLTAEDGTVVHFADIGGPVGRADATEVIEPDGTTYTISANSVVSNRGWALLRNVSGSTSKWCALNLAVTVMPANGVCPSDAPSSSYGTGYFTDQSGVQTIWDGFENLYLAGESTPYLTNVLNTYGTVLSQSFADGRTYSYSWTPNQNPSVQYPAGGSFTDNEGNDVTVAFGHYLRPAGADPTIYYTAGPETVTDQLNRTTHYDYCWEHQSAPGCWLSNLRTATDPEGIVRTFEYDDWDNITRTIVTPKPGSGLAPIETSATYATCPLPKTCAKPTSVTDANGNTTDYTYDPAHGGVLTETGPAVNGVRPQTRYSYAQRFAWIKNSTGGYSPAASPVWLLVEESFCRTSNASGSGCAAGAADEVVTTYDYGPNSGPNNLLLRGKAVTADGVTLRTCYGYDDRGNRISETSPRADRGSCP